VKTDSFFNFFDPPKGLIFYLLSIVSAFILAFNIGDAHQSAVEILHKSAKIKIAKLTGLGWKFD